jgi:hypothetical protein
LVAEIPSARRMAATRFAAVGPISIGPMAGHCCTASASRPDSRPPAPQATRAGRLWSGNTPNLAARLQALAEPGCVLVGPVTYRLTEAFFKYLFVGEHEVVRRPRRRVLLYPLPAEGLVHRRNPSVCATYRTDSIAPDRVGC